MRFLKQFCFGMSATLLIPVILMLMPIFMLGETAFLETLSEFMLNSKDDV